MAVAIQQVLDRCLAGEEVGKAEAAALLSLDPETDQVRPLFEAAREAARRFSDNEGRIWAAIGVDYHPCPMNCKFCSFGERWGIVRSKGEWAPEQVVHQAREFCDEGAHWITLRTTEHYPLEKLRHLAQRVRAAAGPKVELVANTGEFDSRGAQALMEAGFTTAYHVLRLREGVDTGIRPEVRLATLAAVRDSDLKLAHLVEPIGPEHSPEEVVDCLFRALEFGTVLTGAMARVPVAGTPLAQYGRISERALAHAVAVTRLVAGPRATDICVHPPSLEGVKAGANVVVVETGAVPREMAEARGAWRAFTLSEAQGLLASAGYSVNNGRNVT